jgi:hypothetical protein
MTDEKWEEETKDYNGSNHDFFFKRKGHKGFHKGVQR